MSGGSRSTSRSSSSTVEATISVLQGWVKRFHKEAVTSYTPCKIHIPKGLTVVRYLNMCAWFQRQIRQRYLPVAKHPGPTCQVYRGSVRNLRMFPLRVWDHRAEDMWECLYTSRVRIGRSVVVCKRPDWYGGSVAGWSCDRWVEQTHYIITGACHVVPFRDGVGWPCPCMYMIVRWT